MTLKRVLTLALVVAAALPGAALAQEPIAPPGGDNYLSPVFINNGNPLPYGSPVGVVFDTTNYTTQSDMFNPPGSGGPREPTTCGSETLGKSAWVVFNSSKWGSLDVSAAGSYDAAISLIPFQNPQHPAPDLQDGFCIDNLTGLQEDANGLVAVPGLWYAFQIAGGSNPQGGQVQVKLQLNRPLRIAGADAVLSLQGTKVTSLAVKAPSGAHVSVKCAVKGCGRVPRGFDVKRVSLTQPIADLTPSLVRRAAAGGDSAPVSLARRGPAVHESRNFKLLGGRNLKPGTRLEVRVTQFGHVGTYFAWNITSAGTKPKITRCMNPATTKPRKRCT
jgi:hypothetical protein